MDNLSAFKKVATGDKSPEIAPKNFKEELQEMKPGVPSAIAPRIKLEDVTESEEEKLPHMPPQNFGPAMNLSRQRAQESGIRSLPKSKCETRDLSP